MSNYQWVGIDVAKDKLDACLLTGAKPRHQVFANNPTGFQQLVAWLAPHAPQPWIVMESTGPYSEPLADYFVQQAVPVSVVNPFQIKHFAKARLARNKNDKADAHVIAQYGSLMKPRPYQSRPTEQREARERLQLVDTLKGQRTRLKNQLASVQTAAVKQDLQQAIKVLDDQIQALEDKLEHTVQHSEQAMAFIQLVTSIQGVGKISAYRLFAYLPDLTLFTQAKQLAAFIGVTPGQRQSGQWVGQTALTKCGHSRLRNALYMPALCAKRFNPALQPFVQRLEQKGLKPKAIVGAVMRKLVHIIFGMLKHQQPFNPQLV